MSSRRCGSLERLLVVLRATACSAPLLRRHGEVDRVGDSRLVGDVAVDPLAVTATRLDLADDAMAVDVAGADDHVGAGRKRTPTRSPCPTPAPAPVTITLRPSSAPVMRAHHRPAVDDHRRTGDARRGGRGEERDGGGDVVAQVGDPSHDGRCVDRCGARGSPRATSLGGTSTEFTVIPCGPHWRAADFASARIPSTAVHAGTKPPAPVKPVVGATSTIRPVPVGARRAWAAWKVTMVSRRRASARTSHWSGVVSTRGSSTSPASSRHTCTTTSRRGVAANAVSAAARSANVWAVVATSTPDSPSV